MFLILFLAFFNPYSHMKCVHVAEVFLGKAFAGTLCTNSNQRNKTASN